MGCQLGCQLSCQLVVNWLSTSCQLIRDRLPANVHSHVGHAVSSGNANFSVVCYIWCSACALGAGACLLGAADTQSDLGDRQLHNAVQAAYDVHLAPA